MEKVSFILTTYNCVDNMVTTLESILMQDYPEIEIVVADGGSTDGTKEKIEEYSRKLGDRLVWRSEPDKGIYDAMNKGYRMSSGDIIVFFNDCLTYPSVVTDMVNAIRNGGSECIGAHADLVYADGDKIIRKWHMGAGTFIQGWMPGHPTLYLKRSVYEESGLYHTNYRCSADYEFMIRALWGRENRLAYVSKVIVKMYYGGTSTQGVKGYFISLREGHNALRENGVRTFRSMLIDFKRTLHVLGQFVRR